MIARIAFIALLAVSGGSACAYFNALYNAQRHFSRAEEAARRGEVSTAQADYRMAIEKAAKSLRKDPDGRWADDALYLIARSHFARGDYAAAAAALERLRADTGDDDVRLGALAYLGAAYFRLDRPYAARENLDAAVAGMGDDDGALASFARLWRARALFALGEENGAWDDLERAARSDGPFGLEARLEAASRAVHAGEPARARAAFAEILDHDEAHRWADSVRALAESAAGRWGPDSARAFLAGAARAPWPGAARDHLQLFRADLLARAGDTAAALAEAAEVAENGGPETADRARVAVARWRLAAAADPADLADVRSTLLPALAHPDARALVRTIATLGVLLENAREIGQPLALFAAAELARDRLAAPGLARRLFTAYADLAPGAVWAPKALLAAAALAPPDEADALRRRAAGYAGNVYIAAVRGEPAGAAFQDAEERLARVLQDLESEAGRRADRQDALVSQTIAALDSVRAGARADSLRILCGSFLDSLGLAGIRADSVRAACIRGDTLRVDSFLGVDTVLLLDSARAEAVRREAQRPELKGAAGRDTFDLRP